MSTKTKKIPRPLKIADATGAAIAPSQADPRMYLDEADMHKLFHLGSMVDRVSTQIGMLEKDDVNDELNLKLQQETLQRLQSEFTLRRQRRLVDKQQLLGLQGSALNDYVAFRDSLSGKYSIDLSSATFDDRTGLIHFPPPAEAAPPPDEPQPG